MVQAWLKKRVKRFQGQDGLTLMEMLMVLTIIAILSALLMPRLFTAVETARTQAARTELAQIAEALNQYYLKYGEFPVKLNDLKSDGLIKPSATFKNAYGFNYLYAVDFYRSTGEGAKLRRPRAFVLADPGRHPSGQAALNKNDQPGADNTIPEGQDPAKGAFEFCGGTTKACGGELPLLNLLEGGGEFVYLPSLSPWVEDGRWDLITE